jgi:hypothetical protein
MIIFRIQNMATLKKRKLEKEEFEIPTLDPQIYENENKGYVHKDYAGFYSKEYPFMVRFRFGKENIGKSFHIKNFDNDISKAFKAAEQWRRTTSDDLNMTQIIHASYRQRKLEIPLQVKQYIVWFLGGDGTIGLSIHGVSISFIQSSCKGEPEILKYIQNYYGGEINLKNKAKGKIRDSYILRIRKSEIPSLLEDIIEYGIIKRDQAALALEYIRNPKGDFDYKLVMSNAKKLSSYQTIVISDNDLAKITAHALAGLFMAEGCIWIGNSVRMQISQGSCVRLLQFIMDRLFPGECFLNGGELVFKINGVKRLLSQIKNIVHEPKRSQLHLAEEYMVIRSKYAQNANVFEDNDKKRMDFIKLEIKRLKHET